MPEDIPLVNLFRIIWREYGSRVQRIQCSVFVSFLNRPLDGLGGRHKLNFVIR